MQIKSQGHAFVVDPSSPNPCVEVETMTCNHCQFVMFIGPGQGPQDVGVFCVRCKSIICPKCAGEKTCEPWLQRRSA